MAGHQNIILNDWQKLNDIAENQYSKIILLCDSGTVKYCLPRFKENFRHCIDSNITISAGEEHKTIRSAEKIWQTLNEMNADRKSLLITLGGGMLSDLGGFAASVYKRGIKFISIPTTLLAMTDAAIGGKTAINSGELKNVVGTYHFPECIFLDTEFLNTLPAEEWLNGYAEIIKHAIIADISLWNALKNEAFNAEKIDNEILIRSVSVKTRIVSKDPFEESERKKLNFGHTVGHALESWSMFTNKPIRHGYAVAAGMLAESYINTHYGLLSHEEYILIADLILRHFPTIKILRTDIEAITRYCQHDKKAEFGDVFITKIIKIGQSEPVMKATEAMLAEGLDAYIRASS